MRRYADVETAIGAAVRRFGGLDILVNNAGVGVFTNVAEMTPAQWADVIETNLTRCLQRLSRGAAAPAPSRRRVHHQHQQPGGQESIRRRARRTARRKPASTRSAKR